MRKVTAAGKCTAKSETEDDGDIEEEEEEEEEDEEESPIFATIRNHTLGSVRLPRDVEVSGEAERLINAFLNPVPEARPEARAALEHPWLAGVPLNREYSLRR